MGTVAGRVGAVAGRVEAVAERVGAVAGRVGGSSREGRGLGAAAGRAGAAAGRELTAVAPAMHRDVDLGDGSSTSTPTHHLNMVCQDGCVADELCDVGGQGQAVRAIVLDDLDDLRHGSEAGP